MCIERTLQIEHNERSSRLPFDEPFSPSYLPFTFGNTIQSTSSTYRSVRERVAIVVKTGGECFHVREIKAHETLLWDKLEELRDGGIVVRRRIDWKLVQGGL